MLTLRSRDLKRAGLIWFPEAGAVAGLAATAVLPAEPLFGAAGAGVFASGFFGDEGLGGDFLPTEPLFGAAGAGVFGGDDDLVGDFFPVDPGLLKGPAITLAASASVRPYARKGT